MEGKELNRLLVDAMTVADLPEVLTIEKASFKTPWSETLFYNEIFKAIALPRVAKINGKVVGYLCANVIIDEGHILNLAVHPEYRGHKIASRLIQEVLETMRVGDCRSVFLEVRVSNEEAQKMYEKFGFGLLGTRKNYYLSPVEDAVVMVLRLEGDKAVERP
jgi:ribosomal-protein-alanine N-acetyltransferase